MQHKTDPIWQRNAGSQIVLDSIFAALAGIWISIALSDKSSTLVRFIELLFSVISFFCFAVSAEGTATAADEVDVLKYVYYLFWYNVGVVLVGAAIFALILADFDSHIMHAVNLRFSPWASPWQIGAVTRIIYAVVFGGFLWTWIHDAWWILCKDSSKFNEYLKELNDGGTSERQRRPWMRLIFRRRIRNEPATP